MLREAQMVGVRWPPPTDEARLFGHELDVLLVTKAAWLRASKPAFVNAIGEARSRNDLALSVLASLDQVPQRVDALNRQTRMVFFLLLFDEYSQCQKIVGLVGTSAVPGASPEAIRIWGVVRFDSISRLGHS